MKAISEVCFIGQRDSILCHSRWYGDCSNTLQNTPSWGASSAERERDGIGEPRPPTLWLRVSPPLGGRGRKYIPFPLRSLPPKLLNRHRCIVLAFPLVIHQFHAALLGAQHEIGWRCFLPSLALSPSKLHSYIFFICSKESSSRA